MPARARKTVGTKRRKRRTTASKPATARRKTTKRRKKAGTARATTTRRRRTKKAGAKATARRPRRKTTAKRKKVGATRRRRTTRGKSTAVKKKPSKSEAPKKTSESSRSGVNRKSRTLKKTTSQAPAATIWTISKKKREQVKSDSQALPVKQQLSPESKMLETKKTKKREQKQAVTRLKSVSKKETDLNIAPYKERPGEDYMNESQLAHFRRLLEQQKRILLEHMGRTVHHLQDEGVALADMSDRATQEEEFNLELRASDRERKLIKKIDTSLQQIDERNYGFCNSCGVEIGIRRLEARPTANLCIDCKTLDEIREKQMGG